MAEPRPTMRSVAEALNLDDLTLTELMSIARFFEQAIMHSEALNPIPAHWPALLRWRPKGSVFCNGTGTGYKRAGQISPWSPQDYWREPSGH